MPSSCPVFIFRNNHFSFKISYPEFFKFGNLIASNDRL